MPHNRKRILLETIKRRLKIWPVLGLIGARQTGKSTLLRAVISGKTDSDYYTMDSLTDKDRAQRTPEAFTEPGSGMTIFDEIQKVPDLFDAIKLHVDRRKRPGMYIISGSTEFSRMTGIRESLTGRIGILRLYPMNRSELRETAFTSHDIYTKKPSKNEATLTLKQYEALLNRGGMPGFCFLRSDEEYIASASMWLETTCSRDLHQTSVRKKFDSSLALAILREVACEEEPTAATLARKLRKDSRMIQSYLDGLEAILVLHRLHPHPAGVGKAQYVLIDPGLISVLGGCRNQQIKSQILTEVLSMSEAQGYGRPQLYYYRNEKTSRVPVMAQWMGEKIKPIALHFYEGELLPRSERDALLAFGNRVKNKNLRLIALTHTQKGYAEQGIEHLSLRS